MAASGTSRFARQRSRNGWLSLARSTASVLFASVTLFLARARRVFRQNHAIKSLAALAVAMALVLAPLPHGDAHDPLALASAEMARHAALQAEIAEHGHAHDDGHEHEQSSGHMHGHDPADHSHQTIFFAGAASHFSPPPSEGWPSSLSNVNDPGTAFGIDRPPKHSVS